MDLKLEGKVAVVTGAGNGIGRGIALGLAAEGATVVAADLNAGDAARVVADITAQGGTGLALQTDATEEASVTAMVAQSLAAFGQIDILVNNVGGGVDPELLVKLSVAEWDRAMAVNLRSVFLCAGAVAREMMPRRQGSIISIASISGKLGESLMGPYCAGKFGVIGLTQVLAKELGRYGITVNAVCPGYVWTPGWENIARVLRANYATLAEKSTEQIFQERVRATVPLGRPQTAEEIASLVAFLASAQARSITGQAINVDGGAVMH